MADRRIFILDNGRAGRLNCRFPTQPLCTNNPPAQMDNNLQIDDDAFRKRGFGQPMGFGLKSALIVVDLIVGFTDRNMPLGADLDREVEACNRLIQACRAASAPIFFFTAEYAPNLADAGVWKLKMSGLSTLQAGSEAVKIDPRLDFRSSDALIVKKYASCFFGTDLTSRLVAHGVDSVFVTGCTTSGCVRATVVDAVQSGFKPAVVREAVGDRSQAAHDQSLLDMQAKYADVVALDDVLAHLSKPAFIK
jgi:nicotinamidase-related amidase